MGAQAPLVTWDEGAQGDKLLIYLLVGAVIGGFLLGFLVLGCLWVWCRRPPTTTKSVRVGRWEQVVTRALRFIRRRRRIALAFSNYRDHQLRHSTPGRTRAKAKAKAKARPVSPLREGPVYHGSNRRRASSHHDD